MPKLLELFAGTSSVGDVFKSHGWEVYTVDWDEQFDVTLHADIGTLTAEDCIELCGGRPDVIWASPDCSSYSVAAMGHHRRKNKETGELDPQTDYARMCDRVNAHVLELIGELSPKYFFIENPRAGLRTMRFMLDRERGVHGAPHHNLLPIRRLPHEADGHLDQPPLARIQDSVQIRGSVPRACAQGEQVRDPGD